MSLYTDLQNDTQIINAFETWNMLNYLLRGLIADYKSSDVFTVTHHHDNIYISSEWHNTNAIDSLGRTWELIPAIPSEYGYMFQAPDNVTPSYTMQARLNGASGFNSLPNEILELCETYDSLTAASGMNDENITAQSVGDNHITYTKPSETYSSIILRQIYKKYGYTIRFYRQPYDQTTNTYTIPTAGNLL